MKSFNEDDGQVQGHGETFGKCLVVKSLTASLVDRCSLICLIINDVIHSQRVRCVGEDDGSNGCSWSDGRSSACEGSDLSLESLDLSSRS